MRQAGAEGGTSVAAKAGGTVSGNGGDGARGVHLTDAMAVLFGDEEVSRLIHRHAAGETQVQGGAGRGTSVTGVPTPPGDGGDDARGVHLADALVAPVEDEEVSRLIHRDTSGGTQAGVGGRDPRRR